MTDRPNIFFVKEYFIHLIFYIKGTLIKHYLLICYVVLYYFIKCSYFNKCSFNNSPSYGSLILKPINDELKTSSGFNISKRPNTFLESPEPFASGNISL